MAGVNLPTPEKAKIAREKKIQTNPAAAPSPKSLANIFSPSSMITPTAERSHRLIHPNETRSSLKRRLNIPE